jgi:amino acid permease
MKTPLRLLVFFVPLLVLLDLGKRCSLPSSLPLVAPSLFILCLLSLLFFSFQTGDIMGDSETDLLDG